MDEELSRLHRAAQEDATDETAARAYDAALARAGRGCEVEDRFRFKFRCSVDWNTMTPGPNGIRHCADCDRDVHWVTSAHAMLEHMKAGRCVAFATNSSNEYFREMVKTEVLNSATDSAAPCAVEAGVVPPRPIMPPILGGAPMPPPPPPKPGLLKRLFGLS